MPPASYFPLDVNFFDHPKVVGLGDLAVRMHLSAIGYANRLMTDGHIAQHVPGRLIGNQLVGDVIAELIEATLWHPAGEPCPRGHDDVCPKLPGDGWRIHDFLDHNRSREERQRAQEQERDRKAAWREKQRKDKGRQRLSVVPGDARVPRDSTVAGTRDAHTPGDAPETPNRDRDRYRTTHPEELSPPASYPQGSVENLSTSRRQPRRAKLVEPQVIGEAVTAIAGGRRPPPPSADQRRWREEHDKRKRAERLLAESGDP